MLHHSSLSILRFVGGRDLTRIKFAAAAIAIIAIVVASFLLRFAQPVPGEHAHHFRPDLMHQNVDTPGWINTGLLLPTSTTVTRAPRPLYPAAIPVARAVGAIEQHAMTSSSEPIPEAVWNGAVKTLAVENILLAVASLWLFFGLCRYYGLTFFDALCATIFAGTCFGFNFWVAQLTPEILTFFAVVLLFVLAVWAEETPGKRASVVRWAITGAVIGLFLLGKELYFLILFAAMFLCWKRQWISCLAFIITAAIPPILWRLYITEVLEVFDPDSYNKKYGYFVWLQETLFTVPLSESVRRLSGNFLLQIKSLGDAFLYYPFVLMISGFVIARPRRLLVPLVCFALAFSAMYFGSNFIKPRISFMAWPVVCGFSWLAVSAAADWADKRIFGISHGKWKPYLKIGALVIHAAIQFLPVYHVIDYG